MPMFMSMSRTLLSRKCTRQRINSSSCFQERRENENG